LDWFAVVVVMADNRASNHFQTNGSPVHRAFAAPPSYARSNGAAQL